MTRMCAALQRMFLGIAILLFSPAAIKTTAAAMAEYEPGQIIVKLTPEAGKVDIHRQDGLISLGLGSLDQRLAKYQVGHIAQLFPHKKSELGDIYQFDFDAQIDAMTVAEDFSHDKHLLYAEPRYIQQLFEQPNDLGYVSGVQWYLNTVQCPLAWDVVHGDSAVVIGIVDTGVDWDHPDLAGNIWINPGEDVDHDGKITEFDRNNADDDSNGFVDDFFGWDFAGEGHPDNDPTEWGPVHGTHIAGIAAAMTNNTLGVAGVSWNCSILPVKVTRDGQSSISYGYEGIQYAADNGAAVINASWGHYGGYPSQYEQEIIDSASARGAIILSSAGNDPGVAPPDTCPLSYPPWYNHVVAVAATNINDKATSWSFYGSWVDVAAPGQDIYNTWWNDSYTILQGTSMSCPLVAGVAGLLKTLASDMTSDEFEAKMWYASDDIYDANPAYAGRLGGGRVNAYLAVLSMIQPRLTLGRIFSIDDAGGNADGRPDPGETVDLTISVGNALAWQPAGDVGVKVSTVDQSITLLVDSSGVGDIEPGEMADNTANPFRFSVEAGTQAHWTTFYLWADAGNGTYRVADSLKMMIGRPAVLLVDDDGGHVLERFYENGLIAAGVVYDLWQVAGGAKISAEELNRYKAVIWLTGAQAENTLTAEDQGHLSTFLDAGNSLFLSGQNIGDEIGASSFFRDYLGISHRTDAVPFNPIVLYGVEGDAVSAGDSLLLEGDSQISASAVEAVGGGVAVYTYRDAPDGPVAATRYQSPKGYKVVYFAFGYEGIQDAAGYTSPLGVLKGILHWFEIETAVEEGVDDAVQVPKSYTLMQNFPNPFNAQTRIHYTLPDGAVYHRTRLRIYNILGQEVKTLIDQVQDAGAYSVLWDGRGETGEAVSSGVYFYRLSAGEFSSTKKMVLLR